MAEACDATWYNYSRSPSTAGPSGPTTGSFRVNRGGSWAYRPWYCRSANRSRNRPDFRDSYLGFRVAAVPASK